MGKIKGRLKQSLKSWLPGNQPDFIIVGAQKAGTSSLFTYLKQDKNFVASQKKEIDFFSKDINYRKGFFWYEKQFRGFKRSGKLFYEASPSYLYRSFAPARIFNYDKSIKIIILLREPVERSYSAWNMYRDMFDSNKIRSKMKQGYDGKINYLNKYLFQDRSVFPSFEECLEIEISIMNQTPEIEEPSIIRRGIYFEQVRRYFELFPKENILIINFEDIVRNKVNSLDRIYKFLNVKFDDSISLNEEAKNKRSYHEKMSDLTRGELRKFYEPYNQKLFKLINREYNW